MTGQDRIAEIRDFLGADSNIPLKERYMCEALDATLTVLADLEERVARLEIAVQHPMVDHDTLEAMHERIQRLQKAFVDGYRALE